MYPEVKICSKIFDYKFERSDSFYHLKAIVTSADMVVAEYIIWWVEIKEKLGVKKNEMFVASGVRGCDFSLLFSIGEATSKCTGHLPSAREMWPYKGVKGTGASHP